MTLRPFALFLVILPLQALAYAQLRGAELVAGAILDTAPGEVILAFNEPIAPMHAQNFGPDGTARDVAAWAEPPPVPWVAAIAPGALTLALVLDVGATVRPAQSGRPAPWPPCAPPLRCSSWRGSRGWRCRWLRCRA